MGSGTLTSPLLFMNGNAINNLIINRITSGQVKLASTLLLSGSLSLMEGNLSIENGGALTASIGSTVHIEKGSLSINSGTFIGPNAYNVVYTGVSDNVSGVELSGSGLAHVIVNYTSGTSKITLNSNTSVSGKLSLMNGKLDLNGKNLILNGTMMQSTSAWITGNTNSELHLNLTSVSQNTLYFDNANAASQTF